MYEHQSFLRKYSKNFASYYLFSETITVLETNLLEIMCLKF